MIIFDKLKEYLGVDLQSLEKLKRYPGSESSLELAQSIHKELLNNIVSPPFTIVRIVNGDPRSFRDHTKPVNLDILSDELGSFRCLEIGVCYESVLEIQRLLELATKGFVRANLFHSKKDSPVIGSHEDHKDILVLQITGEKKWKIDGIEEEFVLKQGDMIVLPKGIEHSTQSDSSSTHIAFAMDPLSTATLAINSASLRPIPIDKLDSRSPIETSLLNTALSEYKNYLSLQRANLRKPIPDLVTDFSQMSFKVNMSNFLWGDEIDEKLVVTIKTKERSLKDISLEGNSKRTFIECWKKDFLDLKTLEKETSINPIVLSSCLKKLWELGLLTKEES